MQLLRLTATLVDNHNISPEVILDKLDEKYGTHDYQRFTAETASKAIAFFEETIQYYENRTIK